MAGEAEAFDCRQRQLCEVDALQAMYEVDDSFDMDDKDSLQLLRATVESCASASEFCSDGLPCLSFKIVHSNMEEPELSHVVKFLLPAAYPREHSVCRIEWNHGSRADNEYLNGVIEQYATSLEGDESCFQLVQRAEELVREVRADKLQDVLDESSLAEAARMVEGLAVRAQKRVLGRRLVYFHHIINEGKRTCIIDWAVQLQLGGYSKIGWPGVVVVEGPEECCQEYVRSLQRLRWKLMVVRGEETHPCPEGSDVDDLRRMHRGFEETDDMSLLADRCRAAGLEELFLTSMKIYGGRGRDRQQHCDEGKGEGREGEGGEGGAGQGRRERAHAASRRR